MSGLVDAVQAIVDRSEEADQILLGTIALLSEHYGGGVGLRFVEEGAFSDGPWAGPTGDVVGQVPIRYDDEARTTFERVAAIVGDYCLVGWDIGGEDWEP